MHVIKLPVVHDPILCPTTALLKLMQKFVFNSDQPLFILDDYTLLTQSALRRILATFLRMMNLPLVGFGFHTFRRCGASIAYDANVPLAAIKMHGAWQSDALWSYISADTSQTLKIPLAFQALANALP